MVRYPRDPSGRSTSRPTSSRSGPRATTSTPPGARRARSRWPSPARTSPRCATSTPTACRCRLYRPAGARRRGRAPPARRRLRLQRRRRARRRLPAGSPTGAGWPCSASTTGGRRSTGSRRRPTTSSTVVGWLDARADALGLSGPTYAHGDSAGGNLALVAALRHPGRFRAVAAGLPVPRPDRRLRLLPHRRPTASTRARPRGTGSSTPRPRPTCTHPDLAPLRSDRLAHPAPDAGGDRRARPAARRGRAPRRAARGGRRRGRRHPLPRPDARLLAAPRASSPRPSR